MKKKAKKLVTRRVVKAVKKVAKKAPIKIAARRIKKSRPTVVSFILDETGSMQSVKLPTISGFNEYFNSLKDDTAWKTLVTLTKFNSEKMETAYHLEDVRNVPPLSHDNYRPDANTPLYDAIARTIRKTETDIASANDQPAVFCVILTDGEFLSVTACSAGSKHLAFPGARRVTNALDGLEVARDVTGLDLELQFGETRQYILK